MNNPQDQRSQDQQSPDRHDPAIDPDTPDNGMGQNQGAGAQSQDNHGAQSQENHGNQSGENSFTPDFEPEEHESPDTTKEHTQTGDTDRDIDTQGG